MIKKKRFLFSSLKLSSGFFILLFVLSACDRNDVDFEILPEKKMVDILVEIHLHEAASEAFGRGIPDSVRIEVLSAYDKIFEKHGVSFSLFEKNFNYYLFYRLDDLDLLYQRVIDELNVIEAQVQVQQERNKPEIEFEEESD